MSFGERDWNTGHTHTCDDLGIPDLHVAGSGRLHLAFGHPNLLHVVSIGDEIVLVWVDGGDAPFTDEAQTVLDSIVWRDLLD